MSTLSISTIYSAVTEAVAVFRESLPAAPITLSAPEAVRQFVHHVESGNFAAAITLLSSSVVDSVGRLRLQEILANDARELHGHGGVVEVGIGYRGRSLHQAELDVAIRYADGTSDQEVVHMVGERSGWKIDMLR